MRGAKDDPVTVQHVLNLMQEEAERMSRLVNDLVTLARLDANSAIRMEDIDLVSIMIESIKQAQTPAGAGCKVSLDIATQES
jgi:two-component system OmpR family sensor kinase